MKRLINSTLLAFFAIVLVFALNACEESPSDPGPGGTDPGPGGTDPGPGGTDPGPGGTDGPVLFVANQAQGAGNLSRVSLQDGEVTYAVGGLGITPNDILVRENRLYVINSESHSMNVFEMNDEFELTHEDTIDLDLSRNRSPQYAAVSENDKMWISNFNDATVTVLNLASGQVQAYLPVGRSPADIQAVGEKVYVCNSGFKTDDFTYEPGTVSVISTTANSVIATIEVGLNPQFLSLDPDGRLHVSCTGNYGDIPGEIHIIDTAIDSVVQVVYIGGTPGDVAIGLNGIAYIAAGGWSPDPAGVVYSYHALLGRILRDKDNPIEVGLGASRVVVDGADNAYISCFETDHVDKVSGEERVASYEVGDQPVAMVIVE